MKKTVLALVLFASFFSFAKVSNAKVKITTASYQKIVVKEKNGKKVKKWVRASKVVPGDIIKYVDTIVNDSNETLKNVKVINPINEHLDYVEGSAKSDEKFSVKFSIDGGKSFDLPKNLYIKTKDGKKRLAKAKDYNAIEFILNEVKPKSKVKVEFKTKLK